MNGGRRGSGGMMVMVLLAQRAGRFWVGLEWRAVPCARWVRPMSCLGIRALAGTDLILAAVVRATESGRPIRGPPAIGKMEGAK